MASPLTAEEEVEEVVRWDSRYCTEVSDGDVGSDCICRALLAFETLSTASALVLAT